MNPDYRTAKRSAIETVIHLGDDPKAVLLKMRNVLLLSYDSENPDPMQTGQDSYTLVNRKDDVLQYIIVYNQELALEHKRFTLARELAHVILQHDGTSPEAVWAEEADCFASYYINPLNIIEKFSVEKIVPRKIQFRPKKTLSLWEFKSTLAFDSVTDMKHHIAEEQNKFYNYIGKKNKIFNTNDVVLVEQKYKLFDLKNCYDIVLDGKTVGYCGE